MESSDLTLLAGQIHIASSLVIRGLRGDKEIAAISAGLGVLFVVCGILAKRGLI